MCYFVFPGLLEKCFNAFYDSEVVSEEAFEEWVNSKDPEEQEGKGVCITSVQNFMRWLKEADEEGQTDHMPHLPPQFFLNGVNRNHGFVTDEEYIMKEFEVKKWSQTFRYL